MTRRAALAASRSVRPEADAGADPAAATKCDRNRRTVAELGDEGTLDFLTDLMEEHETMAWMLRADPVSPPGVDDGRGA